MLKISLITSQQLSMNRLIISFLIFLSVEGFAQELFCQVKVNARQIEGSEKVIFTEMEKAIFQLINGNKWTKDKYKAHERIECSMLITLEERLSANQFKGNIQVQASRPVFGTSYKSAIMNIRDQDFVINYNQFEPLQYNVGSYNGELVSIISFYIYMILGYNYDSFALEGGTPHFQQAQRIVNLAQSSPELGWKAFEDQNNRYWLIENALSARFKPLRKAYYQYHRMGFDVLEKDMVRGRRTIKQCLLDLRPIHNVNPSSYNMQVFFNAKHLEVISLFEEGLQQDKNELAELLITIDPGNSNKYEKLRRGR